MSINRYGVPQAPRHESPLVGISQLLVEHHAENPEFSLREQPLNGLCIFRAAPNDPGLVAAASAVIGTDLPLVANTYTQGSGVRVLWLGPDEWMVVSHPRSARQVEASLRDALAGQSFSAVDVSSGYTTLEFGGEQARRVLSRGCPLDLAPETFPPGSCAQSVFFKSQLTLAADATGGFTLTVRRSFAEYFVLMVLDALQPIQQQHLRH